MVMNVDNYSRRVISLFAGCGGLDLGFKQAGFEVCWANESDKSIWETYELNHPSTFLDRRDITSIKSNEIPDAAGIIGGPPCQSWSEAGAGRGINDLRGQLFHEYVRVIADKLPLFFVAENVSGILSKRHLPAFRNILRELSAIGYRINFNLLTACHYSDVPQERRRVFIIGYRNDIGLYYKFPKKRDRPVPTLRHAIHDLSIRQPQGLTNTSTPSYPDNHEYLEDSFSSMYLSRNRLKDWDEPSFTILASGRHIPLHPQASPMIRLGKDRWGFDQASIDQYRRLSVRECARIQTFPDYFVLKYSKINDGYKMVGNAVPVDLAFAIAKRICF